MKLLKPLFFLMILLVPILSWSQVDHYLLSETKRIELARNIEFEIQKFINQNINSYTLSEKNILSPEEINHLKEEGEFDHFDVEAYQLALKKEALRKLFFKQNPDKAEFFKAQTIPFSIDQQCINGDFEIDSSSYTFWSDSYPFQNNPNFNSCATITQPTATNLQTPLVNDFNNEVAYIDSTAPGFLTFDPILSAAPFNVNVPTLNTNGGSKCIRLNRDDGFPSGSNISSMSRSFASINESVIDFNFSLIMDNKINHDMTEQPFFRARVYDQNGAIVDEICFVADINNCLFNVINADSNRRILYTGWLCARLNVSSLLNQPGTIEFTVSDCKPGPHFAVVYIDNICGITCAAPQLGVLDLTPASFNCSDVYGTVPIEICGTYQSPANATLSSIALDIVQNGIVVGTVNFPSQLSASSFCFTVLPSDFGTNPTGDFEFLVHANFNVNCPVGIFNYEITDESSSVGPDVTFIDCCQPTLTLTSPNDDHNNLAPFAICQRERSDWIKASNFISFGSNALSSGVVYHAENFVELNPGFEAVFGSQFAAYPEGCSGNYLYKEHNNSQSQTEAVNYYNDVINLEKIENLILITPNPSHDFIDVFAKSMPFNRIKITTIEGKQVYSKTVNPTNSQKVDIQDYEKGVYIVNLQLINGLMISNKLIKN